MTILETFASLTPMLYVSIVLLPVMLYAFFELSKPKRTIPAAMANPGSQLKDRTSSVGRELSSAFFLGSVVAFSAAIIFFVGSIVADYRDSRGIFALPLPAATYAPAPEAVFPPPPVVENQGDAPADPNNNKN